MTDKNVCCDNRELVEVMNGDIYISNGELYDTQSLVIYCKNCGEVVSDESFSELIALDEDEIPF